MADTSTTAPATGSTVDTTKAPAKIVSITELKNGQVWVVTEAKAYHFVSGKLQPVIFADVEYDAAMARSTLVAPGAVSAGPAPVPPPLPSTAAPSSNGTAKVVTPNPQPTGLLNQPPISPAAP